MYCCRTCGQSTPRPIYHDWKNEKFGIFFLRRGGGFPEFLGKPQAHVSGRFVQVRLFMRPGRNDE